MPLGENAGRRGKLLRTFRHAARITLAAIGDFNRDQFRFVRQAAQTIAGEIVRVLDDGVASLDAAPLAGTDLLELRVHGSDAHPHAVLTARLDNLGKGASGAAVQNVRLMLALG